MQFCDRGVCGIGEQPEESPIEPQFTAPWKSVSFSCGGWLQFYLFGVARAIQAAGLDRGVQYCGCSAGALAAAGLVLDGDFDAAIEFCKTECIPKAHGHVSGLFQLADYVSKCIDLLMVPNFKEGMIKPGELQIAITKLPFFQSMRVTTHHSMKDLKQTLLASSAAYPGAPLFTHDVHGVCIDGGLTDFQPIVDEETITISPFYFSDCDIKPSRYVPPWWAALPPKNVETIDWTYNLGFDDAMAYFAKRGIKASPYARPHLAEFRRQKNHAFDTPRRVNYHRFLGYDLLDVFSSQWLSFSLDLGLLVLLLCIWRPIALLLIYAELIIRLVVVVATIVFWELFSLLFVFIVPPRFLRRQIKRRFVKKGKSPLTDTPIIHTRSSVRQEDFDELWTCFTCIFSLSLLMRFFSRFQCPSSVELRKHDRLYKCSIFYRVLRHIV